MTRDDEASHPVVVFDGVCNLCNSAVDLLLKLDRRSALRFASNQGEVGQRLLADRGVEVDDGRSVESIYLVDGDSIHAESSAVIAICGLLGWPWKLATVVWVVPRPVRDWLYRQLASNRYRWFGKRDTCRLPTPAERAVFLD